MLKFIRKTETCWMGGSLFQYISCWSLSPTTRVLLLTYLISIHLMLKFIRKNGNEKPKWTLISIHLMLKFIHCVVSMIGLPTLFQYISCWSLSSQPESARISITYFNTSHVEVYLLPSLYLKIRFSDFNTSHVEVYLFIIVKIVPTSVFQYISCWSLSWEK